MTAIVLADWVFSRNQTTPCPTWRQKFACPAPRACGRDTLTIRQYCCEVDSQVCWGQAATCASDGSTFTCGTGNGTWCCITGREQCTQVLGQSQICWSTTPSILYGISIDSLENTYSSLSAAAPDASSYSFSPEALMAETSATPSGPSTSKPTGSASSTGSSTGTGTDNSPASSGSSLQSNDASASGGTLSGGAIAGIVVGMIGAIIIGAAFSYLIVRSRAEKKKKKAEEAAAAAGAATMAGTTYGDPAAGYPPVAMYPAYSDYQKAELEQSERNSSYPSTTPTTTLRHELPLSPDHYVEMPTGPREPRAL